MRAPIRVAPMAVVAVALGGFLVSSVAPRAEPLPDTSTATSSSPDSMVDARSRLAEGLDVLLDSGNRLFFDPTPLGPENVMAAPREASEHRRAEPVLPLPPSVPLPVIVGTRPVVASNDGAVEPTARSTPPEATGAVSRKKVDRNTSSKARAAAPSTGKRRLTSRKATSTERKLARDLVQELSNARRQVRAAAGCVGRGGCVSARQVIGLSAGAVAGGAAGGGAGAVAGGAAGAVITTPRLFR
jgi:hypothetical protein